MGKIISGKEVSQKLRKEIKLKVQRLKEKKIHPCLAVILLGSNPASKIYVNNKKKACEETGILSIEYSLPETTTQKELLELILKLNKDKKINGILVQLPLPKHIDEKLIMEQIDPKKDVDAFNEINVGKIMLGNADFLPCTPAGIIELLNYENIKIEGKHCIVVGRSNIVGKPMAMLMLQNNATVTICHSKTENLKEFCKIADILICAIGQANFITSDMIKPGAVVIDVGMNKDSNGKLCGDVDFDNVSKVCSYITPVPGGVGPMTITMLLANTIKASQIQNKVN